MNLVIVESPAKAKTINGYLGKDYEVMASFGHVRDLPAKDGSVDPDQDFAMVWEADDKGGKRLSEIGRAAKGASKIILATDPDREGEAISWHVLEVLKARKLIKDKPVERVVFNAITKGAVRDAMEHPRPVDQALVDAYLARRALRAAVSEDLIARGSDLARLTTVTTARPLPSLTLAHRLYRDATRSDDLISRVDPVHPAFMPTAFEALSS